MRRPKYLSPSSISKFKENVSDFYLQYLSDTPPPRMPQNQAMAIGSAFDAYVKSYLFEGLFGKERDPKYEFEALFEAQVEPHNRDWARTNGRYVFNQYQQSGCLGDLMLELEGAIGEPRFEFEVMGAVNGIREGVTQNFGEVTLLGRPDASFITKDGIHVILDWKVNQYCSKYPGSPAQGYVRMRSAGRLMHKMHEKCVLENFNGMMINGACGLDEVNASWAQQLAIYAWLLGEPVGSDFVTIIHQCCANATKKDQLPSLRFAEHICKINPSFQKKVFEDACTIWEVCNSDHIFRNMSLEESQARCRILDGYGVNDPNKDELENWIDGLQATGGR